MKIQIYCDRKGEWRARFVASNGRILFVSGEGYKQKRSAIAAYAALADAILNNRVHMVEE